MANMNPANNLPKRILVEKAFLDYCQLSFITDKEINELYGKIEKLNEMTYESEDIFNKVQDYGLDKITSPEVLKERIKQKRLEIAQHIFSESGLENSELNKAVVVSIMVETGIKKDEAKKLTQAIFEKTLDKPYDKKDRQADRLAKVLNPAKLKEKLSEDYNLFTETKQQNPLITSLEASIFLYTKRNQVTLAYNPDFSDYLLNHTVRFFFDGRIPPKVEEDPSKRDYKRRVQINDWIDLMRNSLEGQSGAGETRQQFCKMIGLMADTGKNLVFKTQQKAFEENYQAFYKMITEKTTDNIDDVLMISAEEKQKTADIEKLRREKFADKSQKIYTGLMAGILCQKVEYDRKKGEHTDYDTYIEKNIENFIMDLKNTGKSQLKKDLNFEEFSDSLSSTGEENYNRVAVHHDFPIGTARMVYDDLTGTQGKNAEKIFEELVNDCNFRESFCEIFNRQGNFVFVIGREKHDSMESNGNYKLNMEKNSAIFATGINTEDLSYVLNQLNKYKGNTKILKDLLEPLVKDNKKDYQVTLGFSSSSYLQNKRQKEFRLERKYSEKADALDTKINLFKTYQAVLAQQTQK